MAARARVCVFNGSPCGFSFSTQARRKLVRDKVGDLMVRWEDIRLGHLVGAGGYGSVYAGQWQGACVTAAGCMNMKLDVCLRHLWLLELEVQLVMQGMLRACMAVPQTRS